MLRPSRPRRYGDPQTLDAGNDTDWAWAGAWAITRCLVVRAPPPDHRQRLEEAALRGTLQAHERAQHFAFVIAFGALAGGVWLLSLGELLKGFALVGGDVLVFGGLYWLGRRRQNKEGQRKHGESRPGLPSHA